MPNTPIKNAGLEYVNGLQMTHVDDENITIAAGQARDSTNVNDIILSAAVTVDGTVNGANGLDTGSFGNNTFYAVYVIGDSTGYNASAGLYSASFTDPNLPGGYDMFRRVGAVLTDGTADLLAFHQYGDGVERTMYYDVGIAELTNGTSTTYAAIDCATSVPPIRCEILFDVAYTPASATNLAQFLPFGSSATNGIIRFGYGVAAAQVGMVWVPSALNSSAPTVQYKVSNGSDDLDILVKGYRDILS